MTKTLNGKMTVAELTEAVALEVMDWKKRRYWRPTKRVWGWYDGRRVYYVDQYRPNDIPRQRDMIVERMRELGWHMTTSNYISQQVTFFNHEITQPMNFGIPVPFNGQHKDNLGIAVMLAAYLAVTGQRVEVAE